LEEQNPDDQPDNALNTVETRDLLLKNEEQNQEKEEQNQASSSNHHDLTCACGLVFSRKYNLFRHQQTVCPFKLSDQGSEHVCGNCKKTYGSSFNLKRHMETVCVNSANILREVTELRKQVTELRQEMANSSIRVSNSINHTMTNSNNVTIHLVNFGEECFSSLTKEEILKIIGSRYSGLHQYVEQTHLNDRLPEQHNVYLSNLRANECKVNSGQKWITRETSEVVDEIIANGVANIEAYLDENRIKLSSERLEKLRDLMSKVRDKTDQKFVKRIKNDIKRLLYDNKDKVTVV
jgi:hypothetical protein